MRENFQKTEKNFKRQNSRGQGYRKMDEECLPPAYKRTYVKSELSSLSSSKRKRPLSASTKPTQAPPIQLQVHESGHSIQQPSESDDTNADTDTRADKESGENEIISIKLQQQQEVTQAQPEENLTKTQEVGSGNGTRIDTDTSPPQHKQSTNTITVPATGLGFPIPKEKYQMVIDAMDRSKSAIFVECDEGKRFVRVVADVDN